MGDFIILLFIIILTLHAHVESITIDSINLF